MNRTSFAATLIGLALAAATSARAEPFTILIHETPTALAQRTDPAKAQAYWGSFAAYGAAMQQAGVLRGGGVFRTGSDVRTVTVRNGKASVAEAPRATGPDQLSGYFQIDVATLEDAIAWAARAPSATTGAVEVRPAYPAPPMMAGN